MKVMNLSGGGTRITGIFEAAQTVLDAGFVPNVFTGVSAGGYIALPLAVGKNVAAEQMLNEITSDMLKAMFNESPVNKNGKLSFVALWNIIRGKSYLGKQERSLDLLRQVVSKAEFDEWARDKSRPDAFVLAIDFISGGRVFESLKDHDYETALNLILASGSIPFFIEHVEMTLRGKRMLLQDGGVRSHIPCREALERWPEITEMVSIYSGESPGTGNLPIVGK